MSVSTRTRSMTGLVLAAAVIGGGVLAAAPAQAAVGTQPKPVVVEKASKNVDVKSNAKANGATDARRPFDDPHARIRKG